MLVVMFRDGISEKLHFTPPLMEDTLHERLLTWTKVVLLAVSSLGDYDRSSMPTYHATSGLTNGKLHLYTSYPPV